MSSDSELDKELNAIEANNQRKQSLEYMKNKMRKVKIPCIVCKTIIAVKANYTKVIYRQDLMCPKCRKENNK